MLREDVVEAAERGAFHVWPIATVDEAVELLTGVPAGRARRRRPLPGGQRQPARRRPAGRVRGARAQLRPLRHGRERREAGRRRAPAGACARAAGRAASGATRAAAVRMNEPGSGRVAAAFLLLTARLGHHLGGDPRRARGDPALHGRRAALRHRGRAAAGDRAEARRALRPQPARAGPVGLERAAVVLRVVLRRLLVGAVHPVRADGRALRHEPPVRRRDRARRAAGGAAVAAGRGRPAPRLRRRRRDLLGRPGPARRRARARGGARDARLAGGVGALDGRDQALGPRDAPAVAVGGADAPVRRGDGAGRSRGRARGAGRARRSLARGPRSTSRCSARR